MKHLQQQPELFNKKNAEIVVTETDHLMIYDGDKEQLWICKYQMQNANFLKIGSLNDFSKQYAGFQTIFTDQKWKLDIQIISLPKEWCQDCRAQLKY